MGSSMYGEEERKKQYRIYRGSANSAYIHLVFSYYNWPSLQ